MIINKDLNIRNVTITILFIFIVIFISFILNKVSTLLNTYKTLNDIKKDKDLQINISKISHELKTPLIVIKGYLKEFNDSDIYNYRDCLLNEIDYALNVLNDFRDVSHLNINKDYFIFNTIINDIKNDIVPFFNNKNIKCRYYIEKNIYLYADKNRIKQVLINIIKNSIESLSENGKLSIYSRTFNNNLIIRIKDNGKGMDSTTLNNLFTPFYTKKENGTGLGLCLSKEIIQKHNGSITYSSIINEYTEAKIVLPINKDSKDNSK